MSDSSNAGSGAFSALEEEFFRAGDEISSSAASEPVTSARTSLWSRLFKRTLRAEAEPAAGDEEDWDWQLALTRARHSTNG